MKESIIQFGTGNFLRGFFDYFIDDLNKKGLYDGKIVVVKPTNKGDLTNLKKQNCVYNLFLRGIENGAEVCFQHEIHSISRVVDSYNEFAEFLKLAHNPDFKFIVSNTTEAGIEFDNSCKFDDEPPSSFPAKVTRFLFERFKLGFSGFIFLPCELIDNNADKLKNCILKYATLWSLSNEFVSWIENENTFANTLVDRIVTGFPKTEKIQFEKKINYEDKLIDTAEPFHLWVIEGDFEADLPLKKAGFNIIWTNDVKPYKKMKVRILNGAHTSTVFPALLAGLETVEDCLKNQIISSFLTENLNDVILKVIGETEENINFAKNVLERFKNPFIHHQLKSISLNSVSKFTVRVLPTMLEYYDIYNETPKGLALSFAALVYYYKNYDVSDVESAVSFIKNNDLPEILSNSELFGQDLTKFLPEVTLHYNNIKSNGILYAINSL